MDKQLLFVANWKMKLNFDETVNFAGENYDSFLSLTSKVNHSVVLCPEAVSIYPLVQMFKASNIEIGAQNCSEHVIGAFTGDISAMSLYNVGCKYCIIGHSERRKYNRETNNGIALKVEHLLDYKVSPVICIGETKEEHKAGKTLNVLKDQLSPVLEKIKQSKNIADHLSICIAYEPIWAIGTGDIPLNDHVNTVFAMIKEELHKVSTKLNWKVLYGGSVNGENIIELNKIKEIDGFLVGKSSLDFQEFKKRVQCKSEK